MLGVCIDAITMTVSITQGRLESLLDMLNIWEKKRACTKRELQALIGKLCFVMKCVQQSRVFLNRLLATLVRRNLSSLIEVLRKT